LAAGTIGKFGGKMKNTFVVEDHRKIGTAPAFPLKAAGYEVTIAGRALTGLSL